MTGVKAPLPPKTDGKPERKCEVEGGKLMVKGWVSSVGRQNHQAHLRKGGGMQQAQSVTEVSVGTVGGPRARLGPLRWLEEQENSRAELGERQRAGTPSREEQAP